jgi:hypothetical protein
MAASSRAIAVSMGETSSPPGIAEACRHVHHAARAAMTRCLNIERVISVLAQRLESMHQGRAARNRNDVLTAGRRPFEHSGRRFACQHLSRRVFDRRIVACHNHALSKPAAKSIILAEPHTAVPLICALAARRRS